MIPKFRVWLPDLNQMLRVKALVFEKDKTRCVCGYSFDFYLENENATIMQSTGILDKNSQEIFKGDVLEIQGIKMIVKFGSYKYLETSKNNGHILGILHDGLGFYVECINAADPDNISPFEPETLKNSQIIGNIYENKELLDA
ncbi:YopX family protein [Streptococcus sp. HMSC070B10]|uniref:YopX family protein n=1 Tax=Streptococcus sp. HMSC070B10 TaxID=1715092 RepID=UPI0008A300C6|nr:YopX family protein [Streptococcus sp. HMSC070B10]OFO01482.1 hypothetical protein HMPREF2613_00825 [Streptococcus sp. HMSC070B10]